jgi:hypothetical protein
MNLCLEPRVKSLGGGLSIHEEYFKTLATIKVESAILSIQRILELEDSQISRQLLASTQGMKKMNNLFRIMPSESIIDPASLLKEELKKALRICLIGNGPHFGEFEYTMASSPNSKGGFGVANPLEVLKYAYISAFTSTKEDQAQLFPQLSSDFPPEVLQLIDTYVTNFPPKYHESIREIGNATIY